MAGVRVLTLNCGSSSLKFDVLDVAGDGAEPERVATGSVERIGGRGAARLRVGDDEQKHETDAGDHGEAFEAAWRLLEEAGASKGIEAVGHRVVHGGSRFREPLVIDDEVIEGIREVSELAPLHNGPALSVIEVAQSAFGQDVPMVAAFDTAFFADLPEVASRYAVPRELSERHGIRRFGFHGLAHADMVRRFRELRPEVARPRLVTLQLGSGCSATASLDGRPLDTSMGYTPLEGLIMGTRSGDLDPALPLRLQALTGKPADEIESLLNTQSGLLGLSGRSADMRDLLAAAATGDAASALAVDAFCGSARKYVAAYMAVLGGAEAVIFGGGIGENLPEIRRKVCEGMQWAGIEIDNAANDKAEGRASRISAAGSKTEVWVVRVDEAAAIAREMVRVLTP